MKNLRPALITVTFSIICLLAFPALPRAFAATEAQANAQALLEEAKKNEFDRKMTAKETEAARLSEDLKKQKQEIDEVDKSIYKVGGAATEATGRLRHFGTEKKRLAHELELNSLRIEAEKLKTEGLIQLGIAHAKAREALTKRAAEIDLKAALVAAEIGHLSAKPSSAKLAPVGKGPGKTSASRATASVSDLRKQLVKAEQATATASSNARSAMATATSRLQQAEAAAAKAEKKHAEVALEKNPGFPGGNDPLRSTNP